MNEKIFRFKALPEAGILKKITEGVYIEPLKLRGIGLKKKNGNHYIMLYFKNNFILTKKIENENEITEFLEKINIEIVENRMFENQINLNYENKFVK